MASGIINSGVVQAVKLLSQFGSVIILSRLLSPADFGVMAMVAPVYSFVLIFHDLGLSQATVQRANLSHGEVNVFFWLNVAMGAVLCLLIALFSPVIGWYYHDQRVVSLSIAVGALIWVGSLGGQHGALLQRRMEFSRLAIIDIIGTLSGLVVSVIAAIVIKEYWALYFGMATAVIIPVIGAWVASGWRPSFPKRVAGLQDMLKFGAGITSVNITTFIAGCADNILIGRTWGEQSLGFYDRAYKLLLFPIQRIVSPLAGTMIPLLSRVREETGKYRSLIHNTQEQLLVAIWPGIIWAVMLSHTLVPFVLGRKWSDAADIFVPLGIASLAQILNSPTGWMFISQGRAGDFAKWGIFNAITSVAAFVIGLPYGGMGVAIAYAASEYIRTPLLWWYATRRGPVQLPDVIISVMPHTASGMVTAMVLYYLKQTVTGPDILLLIEGLVISYGIFALTMGLFRNGRRTLRRSAEFATRLLFHMYPGKEGRI